MVEVKSYTVETATAPWAGAVARTMRAAWFPVRRDADFSSLQAAIDSAQAAGAELIIDGDHTISAALTIDPALPLKITGNGSVDNDTDATVFSIAQADEDAVASTTTSADIAKGAVVLTPASMTGFAVGQLVYVSSTENAEETTSTFAKQHTAYVVAVGESTITLSRGATYAFTAASNTISIKAFTVAPISISLNRITAVETIGETAAMSAVYIKYAAKVDVRLAELRSADRTDLKTPLFNGTEPLLMGISAVRSIDVTASVREMSYLVYGFLSQEGTSCSRLRDTTARFCRHINNFGVASDDCSVEDCVTYHCYGGLDSHEGALFSSFFRCKTFAGDIHAKFRGRRDLVVDCDLYEGCDALADPGLLDTYASNTPIGITLEKTFVNCLIENSVGTGCLIQAKSVSFIGGTHRNVIWAPTGSRYPDYLTFDGTVIDGKTVNAVTGVAFMYAANKKTTLRNIRALGPDAGTTASDARASSKILVYFTSTAVGSELEWTNSVCDGWRSGLWFQTGGDALRIRMRDLDLINNGAGVTALSGSDCVVAEYERITNAGNFADITNPTRFKKFDALARKSARVRAISEAGAIPVSAEYVPIAGGTGFPVTLDPPTDPGAKMLIELVSITSGAVTLALTNVVGGSAGSSASFDATGEILMLRAAGSKWVVIKEVGVTLS
jgi:hypothetical protein